MKTNLLTTTATSPLSQRLFGRVMRDGEAEGGATGNAGEGGTATETGAAASGEGQGDGSSAGEGDATVLGGAGQGQGGETPGEQKGEGADEGAAAEGTAAVPDKYELTPPDGFEGIDTEVLATAEPTLKELNLTNDQAQKLMPLAGQLVQKAVSRAEQAITDRAIENRKQWADAFANDPEIGGANKDKTVTDAARAFDHYGLKKGEGLRQLLDESGLGNHPDLIRFVAAVGRDLTEGTHDRGAAVTTTKTGAGALYGPEFQPKG